MGDQRPPYLPLLWFPTVLSYSPPRQSQSHSRGGSLCLPLGLAALLLMCLLALKILLTQCMKPKSPTVSRFLRRDRGQLLCLMDLVLLGKSRQMNPRKEEQGNCSLSFFGPHSSSVWPGWTLRIWRSLPGLDKETEPKRPSNCLNSTSCPQAKLSVPSNFTKPFVSLPLGQQKVEGEKLEPACSPLPPSCL